jgi:hypothetical protein
MYFGQLQYTLVPYSAGVMGVHCQLHTLVFMGLATGPVALMEGVIYETNSFRTTAVPLRQNQMSPGSRTPVLPTRIAIHVTLSDGVHLMVATPLEWLMVVVMMVQKPGLKKKSGISLHNFKI